MAELEDHERRRFIPQAASQELIAKLIKARYPRLCDDAVAIAKAIARLKQDLRGVGNDDRGLSLRNDLLGAARAACSSMQTVFPRVSHKGALTERRAASRVLAAKVLKEVCMGFAVYYQNEGKWAWSDTQPWDSRPTADNIWAAFTAAEWASQQKLDWSHRERVFDVLKKKDAEVACRGGLQGLATFR